MQKEIENLEFVQGRNFEITDSIKNNGTKYLLIFDNSCEKKCKSKAIVDIATAGRHRGLSTTYIRHNLFHQKKLGRNVDFHNTHIVPFKSPCDVMQVGTLIAQLRLGSELVDLHRNATSVPYSHLLIDFSPRTDDRLRYCTNTGSIPSKFYIPDRLKQSKNLDDEHTVTLFYPSVQSLSHKSRGLFVQSCPEEFIRFYCECIINLLQRKPAKHEKTSRGKISKRGLTVASETYTLQAKKRHSGVRKKITAHWSYYPSRYDPFVLSVYPRSCFRVQQKLDYPVSYKAKTSKVSTFTKSHVPSCFT